MRLLFDYSIKYFESSWSTYSQCSWSCLSQSYNNLSILTKVVELIQLESISKYSSYFPQKAILYLILESSYQFIIKMYNLLPYQVAFYVWCLVTDGGFFLVGAKRVKEKDAAEVAVKELEWGGWESRLRMRKVGEETWGKSWGRKNMMWHFRL